MLLHHLSRIAAVLALGCVLAAFFLPWYVLPPEDASLGRKVVIVKTGTQTAAPYLSLFAAPVVVSLASAILLWPWHSFAWIGGLFSCCAGCSGIVLMFIFTRRVAFWSLSSEVVLRGKSTGWWLCLAASGLVAVSGALAICSSFRRRKRKGHSPMLASRARKVANPDVEAPVLITSPTKKLQQRSPGTAEKLPFSPGYIYNVTPVFDKKNRDWFTTSSNPLFCEPGREANPDSLLGERDFIPAVRPSHPLCKLEELQVSADRKQQWPNGGKSLRGNIARAGGHFR